LTANDAAPERAPELAKTQRAKTRLDQWLWFARFARSRSLAARLCTAGAVTINGGAVTKPNQTVRVGDIVIVAHSGWQRTIRVLALGVRRGPASEARLLYEETEAALHLPAVASDWVPLLDSGESEDMGQPPLS
jgi:ribosome-associated heat shock protein Hsp15